MSHLETLQLGASFILRPSQFIKFLETNESNIKSVRYVMPRLGGRDFGHFRVIVRNPYIVRHGADPRTTKQDRSIIITETDFS